MYFIRKIHFKLFLPNSNNHYPLYIGFSTRPLNGQLVAVCLIDQLLAARAELTLTTTGKRQRWRSLNRELEV